MDGWAGTVLWVDLTRRKIEREPLSRELREGYLGGRGINSRLLYNEVKADIDPLSSENVLIFGTGPLVGTLAPAGENLVKIACIIGNLHRAAARTGMGAVMGSKHLKALAVRGSGGVKVAQPPAFLKLCQEIHRRIMAHPTYPTFSTYGTPPFRGGDRAQLLREGPHALLLPGQLYSGRLPGAVQVRYRHPGPEDQHRRYAPVAGGRHGTGAGREGDPVDRRPDLRHGAGLPGAGGDRSEGRRPPGQVGP